MKGIQLVYKAKRGVSHSFSRKMFGRLVKKKSDSNRVYYEPGILDDIPYHKIGYGKVFISTCKKADFDCVMTYCTKFIVSSVDGADYDLLTGRERFEEKAHKKGYEIK